MPREQLRLEVRAPRRARPHAGAASGLSAAARRPRDAHAPLTNPSPREPRHAATKATTAPPASRFLITPSAVAVVDARVDGLVLRSRVVRGRRSGRRCSSRPRALRGVAGPPARARRAERRQAIKGRQAYAARAAPPASRQRRARRAGCAPSAEVCLGHAGRRVLGGRQGHPTHAAPTRERTDARRCAGTAWIAEDSAGTRGDGGRIDWRRGGLRRCWSGHRNGCRRAPARPEGAVALAGLCAAHASRAGARDDRTRHACRDRRRRAVAPEESDGDDERSLHCALMVADPHRPADREFGRWHAPTVS